MRFTVDTKALRSALKVASRITGKAMSATDPSACVCFESSSDFLSDTVEMRAYNGESDLVWNLPVKTLSEGKFATFSGLLLELLGTISDDVIDISDETETPNTVRVSWNDGNATLPKMDITLPDKEVFADEFENFFAEDLSLLEAIKDHSFAAASRMTASPALEIIHVNWGEDTMEAAASDASILSFSVKPKSPDQHGKISIDLPSSLVPIVSSMIDEPNLCIEKDAKKTKISTRRAVLTYRSKGRGFPNYKNIVPAESANRLVVDRQALLNIILRLSTSGSNAVVGMNFTPDSERNLTMSSSNGCGSRVTETVSCKYEGEPMEIYFPAERLKKALGGAKGDVVNIHLHSPRKAVLISPKDADSGTSGVVVLPCPPPRS